MTGEMFALLSEASVLRHGMQGGGWDEAAFDAGVSDALSRPERLGARLFSLRAEGLIAGLSPQAARARLSGLLIGTELAAARPYWLGQRVTLIGAEKLSAAYARALAAQGVRISMDGKGRYLDNIFIERLWRSLKYECVYLHAWETGSQAKAGVGRWIAFYNHHRPHTAHGGQPPAMVYFNTIETDQQVQAVA